jgi:hypothetical protein
METLYFYAALAATILIPAGLGLLRFKKLSPGEKYFVALLVAGAINESIMFYTAFHGMRNLYLIHIYAVAELLLLSMFFYHSIKDRRTKKVIAYAAPAIMIYAVVYALMDRNLFEFNSIPRAIESGYIIALSILLFYEFGVTGDSKNPFHNSTFIINGGILFYFMSSFIIFAFSKSIANASMDQLLTMFQAHSYVNAISNLIFAIGLWKISYRYYSPAL